jgi:hypothetical protein
MAYNAYGGEKNPPKPPRPQSLMLRLQHAAINGPNLTTMIHGGTLLHAVGH